MNAFVAVVLAYLAGSIPTAYLAGRWLKGIDLRTVGSGNLGATNVHRNLGGTAAIVVLLADFLKGALPAGLLAALVPVPAATIATGPFIGSSALWLGLACGVAAIAGHAKPIFLLWRGGGKGVATAAGVFAALAPGAFAIAFVSFAITFALSRIVSLASISAAVAMPVGMLLTVGVTSPLFLVSVIVSAFVLWSHRGNMTRLRHGTEPRFGANSAAGAR